MLGKILGLNKKHDQGTILGKDDNRYTFVKDEISDDIKPEKNMNVEFVPAKNKKATKIHICETYIRDNSDKIVKSTIIFALLIVICFGFFYFLA